MNILKKGFRKVFVCMMGFIWSLIVLFLVWVLFKDAKEVIAPVLIGILSFGSSTILYLFAANGYEHKMEKFNKNGDISNEKL